MQTIENKFFENIIIEKRTHEEKDVITLIIRLKQQNQLVIAFEPVDIPKIIEFIKSEDELYYITRENFIGLLMARDIQDKELLAHLNIPPETKSISFFQDGKEVVLESTIKYKMIEFLEPYIELEE